jgi:hypothetical protein
VSDVPDTIDLASVPALHFSKSSSGVYEIILAWPERHVVVAARGVQAEHAVASLAEQLKAMREELEGEDDG